MNEILKTLGITNAESEVYITLLKLGPSTVTPIKKHIQISPSKLYEYFNRLAKRGLVTSIKEKNKTIFQATDPKVLEGLVKEKEKVFEINKRQILGLIPQLDSLKNTIHQKQNLFVHLYEGLKGIKRYYELIYIKSLQKGDTHYSMFIPNTSNEKYEAHMLEWHKYRIKKGIKIKFLYNEDNKKNAKKRNEMELSQVRYIPNNKNTPVYIEMFGNYVAVINSSENPYVFVMEGKEIRKTFQFIFDLFWENAKEL